MQIIVNRLHERVLCIVYTDFQSTFEELFLKGKFFRIHHQNIQRFLIEIHKALHNIPTNIYGDQFIGNNHNLNFRDRLELKIPSINSELKGKHSLRYHDSVLWNNITYKIRNLENLHFFTAKIKKWKPNSYKCRTCKPYACGVGFI